MFIGLIACGVLGADAGSAQQRSAAETQIVSPQAVLTQEGRAPSPAIGARNLGRLKSAAKPLEVYGPFRGGTGAIAKHQVGHQDGDELIPPPARAKTALVSKLSVLPGQPARLAEAGPSAIEAFAKLPKPSSGIKPLSDDIGESLFFGVESMRSPALTTLWPNTPGAFGSVDPQIAVGRSVVAALNWGSLNFYDKSGTLLPSTPTFASSTNLQTLFASTLTSVDASLNLNPAVANNPNFKMCPAAGACPDVGDARIIFDAIHSRWVILATAKNDKGVTTSAAKWAFTQRRTKFLLAVSVAEDPTQGFYMYFFNATPNDGACNSIDSTTPCPNTAFIPGYKGDYPSLGVSDKYYLMTDHFLAPDSSDHAYLVVMNAQDVINGLPHPHSHWFADWDMGEAGQANSIAQPVVNQEKLSPIDMGMVVRLQDDDLVITTVSNDDPPALGAVSFDGLDTKGTNVWPQKGDFRMIDDQKLGSEPTAANMINHTLVMAFNDCRVWVNGQKGCAPAVHLFSADVTSLPFGATKLKDRTFGWRSALDDPADDVVGYGMPGIAMNKDGDMAVVYTRTSPYLYPEIRYSAWLHNELDIRPSRLLRVGDGSVPTVLQNPCVQNVPACAPLTTDTVGVALDPYDRTGIWMGHFFGNSVGGYSMAVGKAFGRAYPDLSVPQVGFTPSTVQQGDKVKVSFTMYNGGDGAAQNPIAEVRLVSLMNSAAPKISLGYAGLNDLASGASVQPFPSELQIPVNVAPGRYAIEVEAKIRGGDTTEYNLDNNTGQAQILEIVPAPQVVPPNKQPSHNHPIKK